MSDEESGTEDLGADGAEPPGELEDAGAEAASAAPLGGVSEGDPATGGAATEPAGRAGESSGDAPASGGEAAGSAAAADGAAAASRPIAPKPNRPGPSGARPGAKGRPAPKPIGKGGPPAKGGQGGARAGQGGAKPGQGGPKAGPGSATGNRPKPSPTGATGATGSKPGANSGAKASGKASGSGEGGDAPTRQREARERRAREIERRKAAEAAAAKAKKKRLTYTYGVVAAVVVVAAVLIIVLKPSTPKTKTVSTDVQTGSIPTGTVVASPSPGQPGPEKIAIPTGNPLANTAAETTGQTVNGIQCNTAEQLAYHHHAHLTIYVNGQPAQVPYGIGIPGYQVSQADGGNYVGTGTCFYWLHTHAADGIIHIESPTKTTYSLGDFFAEWGQPLSATQAGPDKGTVTAFYNGKLYTGSNPANLPLNDHTQIQLDIATSVYTGPLIAPENLSNWQDLG